LQTGGSCRALAAFPARSDPACIPRLKSVSAETTLHAENELPRFGGVLRKGYLRTERILADGRRSILGFLGPGDMIGEALGSVRGPALVAATDAELCVLDAACLRRAMQQDPALRHRLLAEAVRQHNRQLEMVWRRGAFNSRERVAAFLVMAAEFMPADHLPDGSIVLKVEVSRKDWADFTNTTPETISRTIGQLARAGLVEQLMPGRYRIRDIDALCLFAGLDPVHDRNALARGETEAQADARGGTGARGSRLPAAQIADRVGTDRPAAG
jgi:CRP/FNR family transcriptional regulator